MIFADEYPPERKGQSPVSPAQRSAAAADKASSKKRPDGRFVHSFRTLLGELATWTKNRVRPADDTSCFELTAIPTPLQREALDRLGITGRSQPEERGSFSAS